MQPQESEKFACRWRVSRVVPQRQSCRDASTRDASTERFGTRNSFQTIRSTVFHTVSTTRARLFDLCTLFCDGWQVGRASEIFSAPRQLFQGSPLPSAFYFKESRSLRRRTLINSTGYLVPMMHRFLDNPSRPKVFSAQTLDQSNGEHHKYTFALS